MPLLMAPAGQRFTVKRVRVEESIRRRLEALGIVPESDVFIFSQTHQGTIVVVKGVKYALDPKIALAIEVA